MPAVAIVGAQWGDEGKGKVVDILSEHADIVVRFQGGNNAGHTLVVGEETTVVHLIPSGVLQGKVCVIGNGVVVDPWVLVEERDALRQRGLLADDEHLRISDRAHLILPYHRAIDGARERMRGGSAIGTTGRGIGPTYEDKMARDGIRFADLLDEATFPDLLRSNVERRNRYLVDILGGDAVDYTWVLDECNRLRGELAGHVTDTSVYLDKSLASGRRVLFEGGQGTMLDIDHGTYPFVTSSNTVSGAIATGAGIAPKRVGTVVGMCKAYTTRVGAGPFPTELDDENGKRLQESGDEFGATTGRPRRCGWFDSVAVRQAARLNGLDGLAVTKLDVLTGFEKIRVCTAYEVDGSRVDSFPAAKAAVERIVPIYEDLPGWSEPLDRARALDDLPANAQRYVQALEDLTGVPSFLVSVGARRRETILLRNPFAS